MKKILLITLICLISSFAQVVKAQSMVTDKLIPIIEAAQVKELKSRGYNDVSVDVLNIPIANLTLPEGTITVKVNNIQENFTAREYKKIDIFVNSKYQRSIGVPMEMKIFENVLVAKETIPRDSVISPKNAEWKKMDILSVMQNVLDQKSVNREIIATKMYRPGEPIDKRFSKSKPDVIKNAMVTVIFKSDDGMSVTVDATALIEGNVGDMVSAQNKTYKKVYMGKVIGPNKILVQI